MAQSSILLKGGTVLFHERDDHVSSLRDTDVLIEGNIIKKIAPYIAAGAGTRTINCTGKIVSPGFIDTHHHLWQTQLKGRFSDDTLFDYMPKGNLQSFSYTPEDIFWGQLGGCLEAIDAGTTFVVDHAHMTYSPDHATEALSATASSGLRSFFCYNFTPRLKSWTTELVPDMDLIPDWLMKQLAELAAQQPFGDGRVYLGWAFDLLFLPKEMVVPMYEQVRKLGIKLITTHVVKNAVSGQTSFPNILEGYGLLGPDILFSHGNGVDAEEAKLLKKYDIFISSTPDTESQMACGEIGCFREDMQASLGIDCHGSCTSDIVSQMRLALQLVRYTTNKTMLDAGKFPANLKGTTEQVFNLGTIQGARAVHMEDQTGSLAEGKLADIVIFDASSPGMICAAEQDPVAAVVRHSSIRDIETVIINGVVRKEAGRLLPVAAESKILIGGTKELSWKDVAENLVTSRERIQGKIDKLDIEAGRKALIGMWHIDPKAFEPVNQPNTERLRSQYLEDIYRDIRRPRKGPCRQAEEPQD